MFFILHVLLKYPFSLRLLLIDIQSVVIPGGICLNFFKVAIPCSCNYPAVIFFSFCTCCMLCIVYCMSTKNEVVMGGFQTMSLPCWPRSTVSSIQLRQGLRFSLNYEIVKGMFTFWLKKNLIMESFLWY